MVLGIAQLRPALASNEPFRNELTLVRRVMPNQPEMNQALDALAAYADNGVPTLPELQASFAQCANAIVLKDVFGTKPNEFERTVISAAAALRLARCTPTIPRPRRRSCGRRRRGSTSAICRRVGRAWQAHQAGGQSRGHGSGR